MHTAAPLHSGESLRELLASRGISQSKAATDLAMSRGHLNAIINGHHPFSAEIKLKLQDYLGVPPSYWNEIQQRFDHFASSETGQATLQQRAIGDLINQLELRSTSRQMLDHEIEEAIAAGLIGIEGFSPSQLFATGCSLTLAREGILTSLLDRDGRETQAFTKPACQIPPGQILTITTRERVRLPSRIRGLVVGGAEGLNGPRLTVHCDPLLPPGMNSTIALHIENRAAVPALVQFGQPVIRVEFNFLADEPVRAQPGG